jgi:hypothetical protein
MLSILLCIGRAVVYYDDSDEDMEDFQMRPKKVFKVMKGTRVSFLCNRNIIHIFAIFWNKIYILGIWLNFNI